MFFILGFTKEEALVATESEILTRTEELGIELSLDENTGEGQLLTEAQ
jgi:hypothetical protein